MHNWTYNPPHLHQDLGPLDFTGGKNGTHKEGL